MEYLWSSYGVSQIQLFYKITLKERYYKKSEFFRRYIFLAAKFDEILIHSQYTKYTEAILKLCLKYGEEKLQLFQFYD